MLSGVNEMSYSKTVCNGNTCCQIMVDENGIETILSCTSNWPSTKMD